MTPPPVERRAKSRGWSLTAWVSITMGVIAFLIALIFAVLLLSALTLRHEISNAADAANTLLSSSRAEQAVIDLETGVRGALLTGEERFLEPYREGLITLEDQQLNLERYADADSRQQIADINAQIDDYVAHYAKPAAGNIGGLNQDEVQLFITTGKKRVDTLRDSFETLNASQEATLAKRRDEAQSVADRALLISSVGLASSLLLLGFALRYILRNVLRPVRQVAKASRRLSDGELETRVPEGGRGEIGALAHSFNRMATALQERNRQLLGANRKLEGSIETVEEASRLKSAFLANMSHEIRTPLNGVMGMTTLLDRTDLDPEQREYVRTARSSGEALMTVINDILDFSKIEAGRLEVDPHDFDLRQAIDSVCDVVAAPAQRKGLQLHSFLEPDLPARVNGDRARLTQILTNLLTNAIKFTEQGEIVLEASRGGRTALGSHVLVRIRDTGIGISPEAQRILFDPFTQADVSTTRRFGGSGLGLAISFELARLMGGTITVESEPGAGSCFTLELPFGEPRGEDRRPAADSELRGLKVLIAEPDTTGRDILETYMTAWEMRPVSTTNGEDTLDLLHEAAVAGEPFDLLLLDESLDQSAGGTISERVWATPSLRSTRIVLLTGSRKLAARTSDESDLAYLAKPISQSKLLNTIASTMHVGPAREPAAEDAAGWKPGTGRILMAEDNEVNQFFLTEVLAGKGYSFEVVSNGREALEMLAQQDEEFDLVLMDCQMPELDGYDATRMLRSREAEKGLPHMPVIAMTAHAMEGDREKCLAAGMDDYIAKPLRVEELDEILDRWLNPPDWSGT
jgi:two-component system, sensor histidine kinase and response regulator